MPALFFEDFAPGTVTVYGGLSVSEDEIIAFAREYDAQPMHVDPQAARHSFVGRLIASGWHTCALSMRMFYDNVLAGSSSMGSPGVEEGSWVKPVLPGDTLRIRQTIADTRASRSRPDMGLVNFLFDVLNQQDEVVYKQNCWVMFGKRGTTSWQNAGVAPQLPTTDVEPISEEPGSLPLWFDDVVVGDIANLGQYRFEAEEIIRYARAFDPQPFHTDAAAARQTHFGGLCASGWQTAAVWMKLMIRHSGAQARRAAEAGNRMGRFGPSPGFRNLRWLRPVYAGDVLTYRTEIAGKRPSATRPQWGLINTLNTATNVRGETVFSFDGAVFWERNPDICG